MRKTPCLFVNFLSRLQLVHAICDTAATMASGQRRGTGNSRKRSSDIPRICPSQAASISYCQQSVNPVSPVLFLKFKMALASMMPIR